VDWIQRMSCVVVDGESR